MITVIETTAWDVTFRQPNHKYILSDNGQWAYGYYKWGEGRPEIFNRPIRMDWRYRKYSVLLKTEDVDPNERKWTIAGSKGNTYVVHEEDGEFKCTCPAATFRGGDCKHIQQVKEMLDGKTA